MHFCLKPRWLLLSFMLMLAVSFAALNISAALWGGARQLDLTADQRFTLTTATCGLLQKNNQPLFVRLYLSPELEQNYPSLAQYSSYVLKMLEQYKNTSHNHISLEVIATPPFSSAEKEAQKQGLRGFLDKSGRNNLYFGAIFSNDQGESDTIPYFEPRRQNYLEHDLSRTLAKLNHYQKPRLGVISPALNLIAKQDSLDTAADWPLIRNLRQDYTVEYIGADKAQISLGIKTLLVVDPQNMPPMNVYAVDQFLMRGGRVLVLLDPFAEAFLNLNGFISPGVSNYQDFLAHRGIAYADHLLIGDNQLATPALVQGEQSARLQNYPLWLDLGQNQINAENPITGGLQKISLKSAGGLKVVPGGLGTAQNTILLSTTANAGTIEAQTAMYGSKAVVKDHFQAGSDRYALAILQEGDFSSFYQQHPLSGSEIANMMFPFLSTSVKPGKLLVVTDADFAFAPNWNAAANSGGQGSYDDVPYNNNYDFIERAVDYLADNAALPTIGAKSYISSQNSISQSLRKDVERRYAGDYETYSAAFRQAKFELEKLNQQLQSGNVLPSAALTQRQELLLRTQNDNQQKLNQVEYQITTQFQTARNRIIIANLLIFPLLLIGLIWLLNLWLSRATMRRAGELAHD